MISGRWHRPPYEDWQDGEPDRAIADCTNAIRLGLRWPGMYLDRGPRHAAKGEHDKAIADYTEAIHLDPKDADLYLFRGISTRPRASMTTPPRTSSKSSDSVASHSRTGHQNT